MSEMAEEHSTLSSYTREVTYRGGPLDGRRQKHRPTTEAMRMAVVTQGQETLDILAAIDRGAQIELPPDAVQPLYAYGFYRPSDDPSIWTWAPPKEQPRTPTR